MAGKIRDEHAQFLIREFLRSERHDFFVGGEPVKKDHRPQGSAGAGFVDVGGHVAAASGGEDSVDFIRLSMREEKSQRAQQQAYCGVKQ